MTSEFDYIAAQENVTTITEDMELTKDGELYFRYKADDGKLEINASKEYIVNLAIEGNKPVDLCFPDPVMSGQHYCFKNVTEISSTRESTSLIKRLSRFLFG